MFFSEISKIQKFKKHFLISKIQKYVFVCVHMKILKIFMHIFIYKKLYFYHTLKNTKSVNGYNNLFMVIH
jgi:hypothetical protein